MALQLFPVSNDHLFMRKAICITNYLDCREIIAQKTIKAVRNLNIFFKFD